MRKHLAASTLSVALTVSLVLGLTFVVPQDVLSAVGIAGTTQAFAQQTTTPKITVMRVNSGKLAMRVNKTYKLGAKTTVGKLSYKSSNEKVATVSSKGVVKAKRAGKATITITAKSGSKKVTKKVPVSVLSAKNYKQVSKLSAKASSTSLVRGKTTKVRVTFLPIKPSNKNVVYKSSNTEVLTVSATGKVKALKAGKAKITVTSCDNAKAKASVTIKVKATVADKVEPDDATDRDMQVSPLLNRSKWQARMNLPTDNQILTYKASDRSPYLVCWPQFSGTTGYTEYAVDVKADSQPLGTYVNIGNWWMDVSSLKKTYIVETDDGDDPGGMYAGFQVLEDGRKVAIMSVWKMLLTDTNGKETVLNAKRTYPANPAIADDFGGEGTGVKTLVDYDWQAGKTYRALIQCGTTKAGNCEVTFSVCDLATGIWTKLISYDLGYKDSYITKLGCFLENYVPKYAGQVRTAEWSNYRAKARENGSWISAKSAKMERQFPSWVGSYNFGSDDSCFWAITSGVPGLCKNPPANNTVFNVSKAATGAPK